MLDPLWHIRQLDTVLFYSVTRAVHNPRKWKERSGVNNTYAARGLLQTRDKKKERERNRRKEIPAYNKFLSEIQFRVERKRKVAICRRRRRFSAENKNAVKHFHLFLKKADPPPPPPPLLHSTTRVVSLSPNKRFGFQNLCPPFYPPLCVCERERERAKPFLCFSLLLRLRQLFTCWHLARKEEEEEEEEEEDCPA